MLSEIDSEFQSPGPDSKAHDTGTKLWPPRGRVTSPPPTVFFGCGRTENFCGPGLCIPIFRCQEKCSTIYSQKYVVSQESAVSLPALFFIEHNKVSLANKAVRRFEGKWAMASDPTVTIKPGETITYVTLSRPQL